MWITWWQVLRVSWLSLTQSSQQPGPGLLTTVQEYEALLCLSFLLAQVSPCVTARGHPHLLPGPASFREGGPTDLTVSAVCTAEAPGDSAGDKWLLSLTIQHVLPTSWLSGHGTSFSDRVLPDTQARKYCLEGIKWVASWWQPKIAWNSEHLFALVAFPFVSACSPAPSTVSWLASHQISRNLSTGCPGAQPLYLWVAFSGLPLKFRIKHRTKYINKCPVYTTRIWRISVQDFMI